MNTAVERLRNLVADVTTFEEEWEDKLRTALPSYDPNRADFPVDPDEEEDYYTLCADRAAEARDQLHRVTIGIEAVARELTDTVAEADQPG
ncbi:MULTISPECIES: hypothetical protein [Kitasatospora]|uniref:Uncharacterized protein n=1 Tax=Kitasatospora cineracea TaxID=88074 RepID=A0A8G1UIS1_9ACTN|nr:hypothetical protein [Kitasatospora cineracea]ROR44753.1 hypothetical protein EDD39_2961 [Kitasatospora cineracea]